MLDNKKDTKKLEELKKLEPEDVDEKDEYLSEMFSQKGSIFLMIGLFLAFILIIIYISRRFF